jgi:hypothetical protein
MATTTIKAYLDFTNNSAVVTLNAGNSANAGISLAAPNVIEDMWLIAQGTLNFTRVIKGSLSTTQIELQEPWNGTTTANVECRISTSGSSVANLTAAVRALISSSTSIGDHIDDAVGAHAASAIANTPAGGISATTVQGALNELDSEKFDKTGGTVSGATSITSTLKVGANTADVTYASGQPLAAVTNANSRVDIVVRNADSGSSAGAGLVINPHGNSWRMGAGSAARGLQPAAVGDRCPWFACGGHGSWRLWRPRRHRQCEGASRVSKQQHLPWVVVGRHQLYGRFWRGEVPR